MTIFIDASAMVAMIKKEPEGPALLEVLRTEAQPLWSAMSCWETVSALQSSYGRPIAGARYDVSTFADLFRLRLVGIGDVELALALDAYEAYGKGRHRAKLNFGDCFAYACAKANGASLLYKGDDFAYTDLA